MALCARIVSPGPMVTLKYRGKVTRVMFSQENLGSCDDVFVMRTHQADKISRMRLGKLWYPGICGSKCERRSMSRKVVFY